MTQGCIFKYMLETMQHLVASISEALRRENVFVTLFRKRVFVGRTFLAVYLLLNKVFRTIKYAWTQSTVD